MHNQSKPGRPVQPACPGSSLAVPNNVASTACLLARLRPSDLPRACQKGSPSQGITPPASAPLRCAIAPRGSESGRPPPLALWPPRPPPPPPFLSGSPCPLWSAPAPAPRLSCNFLSSSRALPSRGRRAWPASAAVQRPAPPAFRPPSLPPEQRSHVKRWDSGLFSHNATPRQGKAKPDEILRCSACAALGVTGRGLWAPGCRQSLRGH